MMSGYIAWCMRENGTAAPEWDTPYDQAPKAEPSEPGKKYIALRKKLTPGRFITGCSTYRTDWYEEIGCFDTMWEAQAAIGIPECHRADDRPE